MIRRYIKSVVAFIGVFILFSCTNEPIQIQKQIKVTISPSHVLEDFVPYTSSLKEMSDDPDYGVAKLRITALLYDEDGKLVDKKEGLLNDYNSDYSCSFAAFADQEYTLVCFSSSIHGSLENPDLESYEFSGIENLSDLKLSQWGAKSYYSNWSVLGVADVEISSAETEYKISLRPATAFVYLLFSDIHANDSAGSTSDDCSGVYSATATDYFDQTFTWEIEIEQYGSSVIVKNLSPFFLSYDINSENGCQIYEGYIENGYIILPKAQEVGYYEDGMPAELYGVTEVKDNTIYVDDICIKIGNGTLTFETGFATYLEGAGWFDAFLPGVVFTSESGAGIDRYGIIYHNNDIVSYDQKSGFAYSTSLDVVNNNGYWLTPADSPSSSNIYTYMNLLPGEFNIFARTFIGNESADYSTQDIKIEAGKQYYIELNCENMSLKLIPGVMKSVSWDPFAYSPYRNIGYNYVSSDTLPFVQANGLQF